MRCEDSPCSEGRQLLSEDPDQPHLQPLLSAQGLCTTSPYLSPCLRPAKSAGLQLSHSYAPASWFDFRPGLSLQTCLVLAGLCLTLDTTIRPDPHPWADFEAWPWTCLITTGMPDDQQAGSDLDYHCWTCSWAMSVEPSTKFPICWGSNKPLLLPAAVSTGSTGTDSERDLWGLQLDRKFYSTLWWLPRSFWWDLKQWTLRILANGRGFDLQPHLEM